MRSCRAPDQARLQAMLRQEMRTNTYDPQTGVITVSDERAQAIKRGRGALLGPVCQTVRRRRRPCGFNMLFRSMPRYRRTRPGRSTRSISGQPGRPQPIAPAKTFTYTSNWPYEPLVGNTPTGAIFMWTFISIFVLLAAIGALVWYYAKEFDIWRQRCGAGDWLCHRTDFMEPATVTPSMRATGWFFMVVAALFVVQVLLGIVTAHYAVEGQGIYGLPLSDLFPYAVTRTWHTQLAVLVDRHRVARDRALCRAHCSAARSRGSSRLASGFCWSAWS